jgi:hypothetical protein
MEKKTRVIGGVPQHVYELPIDGDVAAELAGIDLAKILDRIIIGPTQFAGPMRDTFIDALTKLGVSDPARRVVV